MDQSIVLHTHNPKESLAEVAADWGVATLKLDYKILSFSSSYTKDGKAWTDVGEKDMSVFEEDEYFLQPKLEINQDYKIEISSARAVPNKLESIIEINSSFTRLNAKILKNPDYIYRKTLAFDLMQSIYKQMIDQGYIIGLRIFDFKQELLKLAHFVKENGADEDMQILISRGVEPKNPADEYIIYHYQEKMKKYKDDIGYQGFAIDVKEGELLAQKIKTFRGRQGRDLKFRFIEVLPLKEKESLKVQYNSAQVEESETELSFDYKALKNGFILRGAVMEIESELDFSIIDFKKTGSIYFDLDKDITINVKNTNPMDEAIKSRVNLQVAKLNIIGNIASTVNLKAKILRLDGFTHVKCNIEAEDAMIKTLRCNFKGDFISVDSFENADIEAKTVVIKKAVGGVIRADRIYIDELFGGLECFAKEIIVINKCVGQNRFHIQGHEIIKGMDGEEKDLLKELEELYKDEEDIPKRLKVLKYNINLNKASILALEKKIKNLKTAGQSVPTLYSNKIKAYSNLVKQYNELVRKKSGLDDEKTKINTKLELAQRAILNSKLINKMGVWSDANEISFHLFYPEKKKLFYSSTTDDKIKQFCVKDNTSDFELLKEENFNPDDTVVNKGQKDEK